MCSKDKYLIDFNDTNEIETSLMVLKIIFRDNSKVVCMLGDKTGEVKSNIPLKKNEINVGNVLKISGIKNINLDVKKYEIIDEYNLTEYLPTTKKDINKIMQGIDILTEKYILSREGKYLNDYFFKDKCFEEKFKKAIGGVSIHHNYLGGLAEHTFSVMEITAFLAEKYDCRHKEIAVLSAKFHDIGKIYELYYEGPFKYTMRGELEGHIVIGLQMIDRALEKSTFPISDNFINRVKGCITQHHGKLEYGSPKVSNMEESFIINYADSIDALMNRISNIKEHVKEDSWSEYDRKLETRILL